MKNDRRRPAHARRPIPAAATAGDPIREPLHAAPATTAANPPDEASTSPLDDARVPLDGPPPPDRSSRVLTAARNRWPIVAAAIASTLILALLVTALQPRRYRATAIAAVTPLTAELTDTDVLRGIEGLDRRVVVATVAALAMTPVTLRAAGTEDYTVRAAVLPNTNLFRIEVDGRSPAKAAEIANQIPSLLSAQARSMYRLYGVTLISEATAPGQAFAPRTGRAVVAGILLGLIAGVAIAYLLEERQRLT